MVLRGQHVSPRLSPKARGERQVEREFAERRVYEFVARYRAYLGRAPQRVVVFREDFEVLDRFGQEPYRVVCGPSRRFR